MVAAPRTRTVIASIVASCALLTSSAMQAHAAPQASSVLPAPNPASQQGQLLSSQLDDLFARYSPVDHLGRPTPETAAQIRHRQKTPSYKHWISQSEQVKLVDRTYLNKAHNSRNLAGLRSPVPASTALITASVQLSQYLAPQTFPCLAPKHMKPLSCSQH